MEKDWFYRDYIPMWSGREGVGQRKIEEVCGAKVKDLDKVFEYLEKKARAAFISRLQSIVDTNKIDWADLFTGEYATEVSSAWTESFRPSMTEKLYRPSGITENLWEKVYGVYVDDAKTWLDEALQQNPNWFEFVETSDENLRLAAELAVRNHFARYYMGRKKEMIDVFEAHSALPDGFGPMKGQVKASRKKTKIAYTLQKEFSELPLEEKLRLIKEAVSGVLMRIAESDWSPKKYPSFHKEEGPLEAMAEVLGESLYQFLQGALSATDCRSFAREIVHSCWNEELFSEGGAA